MENRDFLLTSSQSSQQFSVCLWDYNTKNTLKIYRNGGGVPPKTLEIIGQDYILSAEEKKPLLHVWPLNSQEIDKNVRLILPGPATCLSVCPKNAYLAVAIETKLYIWQLCSGKLLSVQQHHYQPITCIKFSSDSEYVAVTGEDGILVVYFLADLVAIHHSLLSQSNIGQVEPVYTKNDHSMPIRNVHIGIFSRNARIATASSDNTLRIYTLSTGDSLLTLVFDEPLTSLIFDSPCWKLYVGSNSGTIKQYNLKTPPRTLTHHVEKDSSKEFVGHKKKVVALALNFSNSILASGSEDNFAYTWDLVSRQVLQKFEHKSPLTNLRFVPNYTNFFEQVFKPTVTVKSLDRSVDLEADDFTFSLVQNEDIEFSDDENCVGKEGSRGRLEEENVRLRVTNSQLYRAALEISKKFCYEKVNGDM